MFENIEMNIKMKKVSFLISKETTVKYLLLKCFEDYNFVFYGFYLF